MHQKCIRVDRREAKSKNVIINNFGLKSFFFNRNLNPSLLEHHNLKKLFRFSKTQKGAYLGDLTKAQTIKSKKARNKEKKIFLHQS